MDKSSFYKRNKSFVWTLAGITVLIVSTYWISKGWQPSEAKEILAERTITSKVYDLGNGKKKSVFHGAPIHYLDENGNYQDIDTTVVPSESPDYAFQVEKGIYKTYFKKLFSDENVVSIAIKNFNIGISSGDLKLLLNDGQKSVALKKAQAVEATTNGHVVVYKNAYGEGLDVEMEYGRTAFRRELVLSSYQALGIEDVVSDDNDYLDLGFEFAVDVNDQMQVEVDGKNWNGKTKVTNNQISFIDLSSNEEIFTFVAPVAIDASGDNQALSFKIQKVADKVVVTKVIPVFWLKNANYPVRADDTSSFFPSADQGTYKSVIGFSQSIYDDAHDATSGTTSSSTATTFAVGMENCSNACIGIYRALLYFDTSSINDTDTIDSATVKLNSSTKSGSGWSVVLTSWLEGPTVDGTDYDMAAYGPSLSSIAIESWSTSVYNNMSVSDVSVVDPTGNTYFGIRSSKDIDDVYPPGVNDKSNIRTVDFSGTSRDPILEVVHTPVASAPTASAITPIQDTGARTVTFSTTVADTDLDVTSLDLEWSSDNSTWNPATISNVTVGGNEGDGVITAFGSITDIDTDIDGSVDLTITWNVGNDYDDTYDTTTYFRITPNDGTTDGSTVTSASFRTDTLDPATPGNLTLGSVTSTSATLNFGAQSSDAAFDEYLMYYKQAASGVTISDTQHVDTDLNSVTYNGTTSTSISGLAVNTQYVANIWAYDTFTNNSSATELAFYTAAATPATPTVTALSTTSASLVINANGNPAPTDYTICSTSNGSTCANNGYLQADGTLAASAVWQNRATWGGDSGQTITGLSPNTAYQFLVKARNEADTETDYSTANAAVYTYASQVTDAAVSNTTTKPTLQLALTWTNAGQTGLRIEQDNSCDGSYDVVVYNNIAANSSSPLTINSDISANTCYQYKFSSYDGGATLNSTSPTTTAQITTPPGQPQNLTVTSADDTEITLDWDSVTGADSYKVYDASDDSELASVNSPTTATTITGLTANTEYNFYVRAVSNSNGTGIASSTVTQTTDAAIPSNLGHTDQTTSSITWTWDDDGQTSFYARDKNNTADNSGEIFVNLWQQLNLSTNTAYTVQVKAKNAEATETAYAEITRYTSQNAPTGVSFSAVTSTSITVTADGDFPNNGTGSSLINFNNGAGSSQNVTSGSSWINSGLTPNTQYTYTAYATNGDGDQTASVNDSQYTLANTPGAPDVTHGSLVVVIDTNSNPASTEYAIKVGDQYAQADGTLGATEVWQTDAVWGGAEGHHITQVTNNTQYTIRVKARNADNIETDLSDPTTMYTLAGGINNFEVANTTDAEDNQVELTWDDNGQSGLKFIQDTDCNGSFETTIYDNPIENSSSPLTVPTTANTCYIFAALSYNGDGDLNENDVPATLEMTTPPAQPQNLTVTDATNTTISLSWDVVVAADTYKVYNSGGGAALATVATTETTLTGLTPDTSYSLVVRAIDNANGEGIASSAVVQVTDANAVNNLRHVAQTTSSLRWMWDDDGQAIFYAQDKNNTSNNSGEIAVNYWSQTGLLANTSYTGQVRAENSEGEATDWTEATAATSQNAPTGMSFSSITSSGVTVTATGTFQNNGSGSAVLHFDNGAGATQDVTSGTSWANSDLTPNTEYQYTLYATNIDGDQTTTVTDTVVTAAAVPGASIIDESEDADYKVVIDTNDNPGSTLYAIKVDGSYLQRDGDIGDSITWLSYDSWGGSSGKTILNLNQFVDHTIYVKAKNSEGTETDFSSPVSTIKRRGGGGGSGSSGSGVTVNVRSSGGGRGAPSSIVPIDPSRLQPETPSEERAEENQETPAESRTALERETETTTESTVEEPVQVDVPEDVGIALQLKDIARSDNILDDAPKNYGFVRGVELQPPQTSDKAAKAVKVTIPIKKDYIDENLEVWVYDERGQDFVYLPGQVLNEEEKYISFETTKVGDFVVFNTYGKKIASQPTQSEQCSRNSEEELPFEDLNLAGWANQYIQYVYGKCIVNGRNEEAFAPLDQVTRAEFLKMVLEAFKLGVAKEYKNFFLDVPENAWYSLYAIQGWKLGIIQGDYKFRPTDPVTRAEALKMLAVAARFEIDNIDDVEVEFSDVSENDWFYDLLKFALKHEIFSANQDKFRPHDSMIRAEAAKVISLGIILKDRLADSN